MGGDEGGAEERVRVHRLVGLAEEVLSGCEGFRRQHKVTCSCTRLKPVLLPPEVNPAGADPKSRAHRDGLRRLLLGRA